jgi:hypothetical protein
MTDSGPIMTKYAVNTFINYHTASNRQTTMIYDPGKLLYLLVTKMYDFLAPNPISYSCKNV